MLLLMLLLIVLDSPLGTYKPIGDRDEEDNIFLGVFSVKCRGEVELSLIHI